MAEVQDTILPYLDELSNLFESNQAIDISTANTRIHIDRQLPYLVAFRNTPNTSQASLDILGAFSSYILLPSDNVHAKQNKRLINHIIELQKNIFEGCLFIEIWFKDIKKELSEQGKPIPQHFTVTATIDNYTQKTLDTLENALQKIVLRKQKAVVDIQFNAVISPPGLQPIIDTISEDSGVCMIGIEIEETYQNRDSQQVFPFALKTLKHGLATALNKTVYTFSHEKTLFKPAHSHELGRQSLTELVWKCDRSLAEISESFDLLLHVTPVNSNEAWQYFKNNQYSKSPIFHYRPRTVDPALLKRELYEIPLEQIEDPAVYSLLNSKREELDEQISLLHKRETPHFLYGSLQVFGSMDQTTLEMAHKLLTHNNRTEVKEIELLDANELAKVAEETIGYYRKIDPSITAKIEIKNDISGILVSHGNFLIGTDANVSKARVKAAISHEIETHVLTYHNGRRQPFRQLYSGMARYEELQEGLAVLSEYFVDELTHDRLTILAARVIAVDSIIDGADFIETFNLLTKEYNIYPHSAFYTSMRVHRGGGYTKDMIYLRGLMRLLKLIASGVEINLLYTGKISFDHLPIIEELYWRKIITPPLLLPRYLQNDITYKKIDSIKQFPSLETIIKDI